VKVAHFGTIDGFVDARTLLRPINEVFIISCAIPQTDLDN